MPDPKLTREGNLRLACVAGLGWPGDPLAVAAEVRSLATAQGGSAYGAAMVLVAGAPDDEPPSAWECHVGCAVTGMPKPGAVTPSGARLMIEDYRNLAALSLVHHGPVRLLGQTWRRLADHGRSLGHRLRPYWRVRLRRTAMSDGNLLPAAEVAVFLDP